MGFLDKFRTSFRPPAPQEDKKHAPAPAREEKCNMLHSETQNGLHKVSHATLAPEKYRRIRDQRWEFCRECKNLIENERLTETEAVAAVLARSPERWPLIRPNYHNFRRWTAALGKKGREIDWQNIDALLPGYHTGAKYVRNLFDERVMRVFLAMYLNPRRATFACCYRETKALFAREYREIAFPTAAQIRYQLKRLPAPVVEAGRVGLDYAVNHSLYMLIRDWDKVRPNQVWFADSRPEDIFIRVPDPRSANGWKTARPQVTYFMDAASWYCVGFDATAEGVDNDLIRNVFARACIEHGRPEVLYIDNGKDYNKLGFTAPVSVLGREYSILQSLDVRLTNAMPYRGRSKTVERQFRDYAADFDRRQPSYLGDSPEHRPDSADLYSTPEGVMLLPTLGEFVELFRAEVEKYNRTPRGGRWHGKSPAEVFAAPHRVIRPAMPPEELRRALLLPLAAPRTVFRGGCVSIDKVQYYARELFPHIDRKVVVKTSYLEPGRVHAFAPDGTYIAECVAQTTTHPLANIYGDDNDKAALANQLLIAGNQYKQLRDQMRGATMGLAGLAIEDIKRLSRAELESGTAAVTVLVKHKVKAGNHTLPLLTTRGAAAGRAVSDRRRCFGGRTRRRTAYHHPTKRRQRR